MKRIRVGGLCLAACCVLGTTVAASASAALPEFTGPFSKPFSSKSGASRFRAVSGKRVRCTADTNVGEITGPQTGSVTITFTGCALKKVPCNTPGSGSGEIVTPVLAMKVGYINKVAKIVGVDLTEPAGGPFLVFSCTSGTRVALLGSVIGRVVPVNKLVIPSKTFQLNFVQAGGFQNVTKLEGEPVDTLEMSFNGPFETAGFGSQDQILFAEPVTLIA
jgi:hypothetical protein